MAVNRAVRAATAAVAQPLVKVVAVLAKVFDPRATVVGAASTPTGASLIRLPLRVAEKQPNSTPAVVLDMMTLLLNVAPLAPRSTPSLEPDTLLPEAVPPFAM